MNAHELDPYGLDYPNDATWITENELLSRNYTRFGIGFHFGRPESVEYDAAGWPVNRWSRARVDRYEADLAAARPGLQDTWRTGTFVG